MSGRTYLSIGDVLTLLRQEFPDVTISKIRFLESQGLVNPERTPSGYRKFYEQDVERLRWVLRQQREHFLPLKVIKGRLDEGADDSDDLDDLPPLDDLDSDPLEEPARERPEPVLVGQGATLSATRPAPLPAGPAAGPALPGFDTRSPAPAPVGEAEMTAATFAAASEEELETPVAAPAATARRGAPARPAPAKVSPSKASDAKARDAAAPDSTAPESTVPESKAPDAKAPDAKAPSAKLPDAKGTGATKGHAPPVPAAAAADPPVSTIAGASMTIEELAQATGLAVGDVQQLESYGLVVGRPVGGVPYYDDDALAVARTAAAFARFGVEARHLRFHKHAAEREAGFIEQIVLPLLKQRNPEARQRALDNVAELSRLGQSLRTVLLRNALRDQLGG